MKNLTALFTVTAIAVLGATSAWAGEPFGTRAVPVRFADLDTSSAAGAAALYNRIANAAHSACHEMRPGLDLGLITPYRLCVHEALAGAIVKVNLPAVSAYARTRGVLPANPAVVASK